MPATNSITLETLTPGLPVRVTLQSGRKIEGYVHSVQSYDRTGFHALVSAGRFNYNLHHYVTSTGLSESVGCMHFGTRVSAAGTVATIESLV